MSTRVLVILILATALAAQRKESKPIQNAPSIRPNGGPVDEPIIVSSSAPSTLRKVVAGTFIYGLKKDPIDNKRRPILLGDSSNLRFVKEDEVVKVVCIGSKANCHPLAPTKWSAEVVAANGTKFTVKPAVNPTKITVVPQNYTHTVGSELIESGNALQSVTVFDGSGQSYASTTASVCFAAAVSECP